MLQGFSFGRYVSKISILAAALLLSACGGFESRPKQKGQYTLVDAKGNFEPYTIHASPANFAAISQPKDAPEVKIAHLDFARSVRSTSISNEYQRLANDIESKITTVKIKRAEGKSAVQHLQFDFSSNILLNKTYSIVEKNNLGYTLLLNCQSADCITAWLRLTKDATGESVEIRYQRSTEYLTADTSKAVVLTNPEAAESTLVKEALAYGYPVDRHTSLATHGRATDILVIKRPPADEVDEILREDLTSELTDSPVVDSVDPETIAIRSGDSSENNVNGEDVVELVMSSEFIPSNTDNGADISPSELQLQSPDDASDNGELYLTTDPNAYYNIYMPEQLMRNPGHTIRDPLQISTHFSVEPIHMQEPIEPAFRIAFLAKTFVEQKIKIYRNACNIYVRAVMALAGYRNGGHFLANDFHRLFLHQSHKLNEWEKSQYTHKIEPAYSIELAKLKSRYDLLPEGHGVVMQVIRTGGRHGHVGILTREDGQLVIYDASLNQTENGPRRTVVQPSNLIKKSRPKVNIFSIPNLIRERQI